MSRSLSSLVTLAAAAAALVACGPTSTNTPPLDGGTGADRVAQHDAQLDRPVQLDGPLQHDGPLQQDAAQQDAQQDAGPATLYPDIRALQQDPSYGGALAPIGSRVRLEAGVVTASSPTASVFFVQNAAGPKEYSGIVVKRGSLSSLPQVGDVVTALEATLVEESRFCTGDAGPCPTRHSLSGTSLLTVNGGAGTVPDPLGVTTAQILGNGGADAAKYDGVLLQLTDSPLTVQSTSGGGSSITITVAAGAAIYSNYYAPPGLPPNGTVITTAVGPLDVYNRSWEIYPRTSADLIFQDWPPDGGVQQDSGVQQDAAGQQDGPFAGDAGTCGSETVVISQIYGGGGNQNATFKNDFVELFNRGTATVDVGAWSVQYAAYNGTTWTSVPLTGKTIPAGGYLLIQGYSNGAVGGDLPQPEVTTTLNLSAYRGKLALSKTATALTGTCPLADANVVDLVGYSVATDCSEGGTPATTFSSGENTKAVIRKSAGCQDFNNNSYDFTTGTPTPRNSATTPAPCGC